MCGKKIQHLAKRSKAKRSNPPVPTFQRFCFVKQETLFFKSCFETETKIDFVSLFQNLNHHVCFFNFLPKSLYSEWKSAATVLVDTFRTGSVTVPKHVSQGPETHALHKTFIPGRKKRETKNWVWNFEKTQKIGEKLERKGRNEKLFKFSGTFALPVVINFRTSRKRKKLWRKN